jgi:ribosome-binding factor A
MSIRAEKVASVIIRCLSEPVSAIAAEHSAGLATVTSVKLSPDLQIAKVYISVYGGQITPARFLEILELKKSVLRRHVGSNVKLRFTPEIRLFLDDTLDQIDHIQKLLDSVKTSDTENNI